MQKFLKSSLSFISIKQIIIIFDVFLSLKDVQYSMILDVFDLCTPELQKRLMPMREKIKISEDAKLDRERAKVLNYQMKSFISIMFYFRNSVKQLLNQKIYLVYQRHFLKVINKYLKEKNLIIFIY